MHLYEALVGVEKGVRQLHLDIFNGTMDSILQSSCGDPTAGIDKAALATEAAILAGYVTLVVEVNPYLALIPVGTSILAKGAKRGMEALRDRAYRRMVNMD